MNEDKNHHLRLLLLSEAEGRIEGEAKYHKLLYKYADEEADDTSLSFIREERGPFNPGLSQTIQRYNDLGLVEVDDEKEPNEMKQTKKGERYMSGYEKTKLRLDEGFQQTKKRIRNTIEKHGDKSASEMVEEQNIQNEKEEPIGRKLK